MTPLTSDLELRLRRARTHLLLDHPFFGALLFRLTPTESPGIETMATDGLSLFYDPPFVEGLPPGELLGVLAHEVMHPALHHDTRRGERDPKLWNRACDYAINPLLLDAGLSLPEDRLFDPRFVGMSAEQIYNMLDQEQEQQPAPSSQSPNAEQPQPPAGSSPAPSGKRQQPSVPNTPGGFGQVIDAPQPYQLSEGGAPIKHKEGHELDWQAAVEQAESFARLAGKSPAGLARSLESGQQASVDWRELLRRIFSETLPADYSWLRPNRRYVWQGLYLPGILREGVGEIVLAVDCSGSISRRVLGLFQEEITALIAEHLPERVHVLYFDAIIHRHEQFERGLSVTLNPTGGGGTDFAPVFDYVREQAIVPHTLILLTDLAGSFPTTAPSYPVIWASTQCSRAPFGAVVPLHAA